jgi:hypothetical protein
LIQVQWFDVIIRPSRPSGLRASRWAVNTWRIHGGKMAPIQYEKYEKFSLIDNPDTNEKWVQEIIAEDPAILGLGDLVLRDKERIQPRAGRLDLLL